MIGMIQRSNRHDDNGFQSTRPRRGATSCVRDDIDLERTCFNPRARGARRNRAYRVLDAQFVSFNPRAREGATSPNFMIAILASRPVSIHAPAMGATMLLRNGTKFLESDVSIHAPARARPGSMARSQSRNWFQSTRPRWARHQAMLSQRRITCSLGRVSIHAPAMGATTLRS